MDQFLHYFEHLNSIQKLGWIVGTMTFFWILEGAFPAFKYNYKKWQHSRTNFVLLGTTILINVLFGILALSVFQWVATEQVGLLGMIELPVWAELVMGLMLLDFVAQYGVHYLLHKFGPLWRFHMIHHSDTHVDVTTGTRHHPGDYVFREIFSLLAVVVGGIPFGFYMVYRILTVLCTYFTHSNIALPAKLDKVLSYVIVTPSMHKFHHHFEQPWTDSNFGNILSIWDRLFGTFVYGDSNKVKYGLDVLDNSRSEDLSYQLKMPFDKSIKIDD